MKSLPSVVVAVVLDTNAVQQDWLCEGLRFELLKHNRFYPPLNVHVPAVVVEELVANHAREVQEALGSLSAAGRKLRRLGVAASPGDPRALNYREHLLRRFDEILGITVLDWPLVDHRSLVARAVSRTPPFDSRGTGYRDALVWADVLTLAAKGGEVVLVSQDRAFGATGVLHPALAAEAEALPGSVCLVDDFGAWLLDRLPWKATALIDAVAKSRDEQFAQWFMASDFQDELVPEAEDLALPGPVYAVEVHDVEWDGYLQRVGERDADGGLVVVEYDIGQTVGFDAELAHEAAVDPVWEVEPAHLPGRVLVRGVVDMVVRTAVLYETDYWGIEEVAWRRADGQGPGAGSADPDPRQAGLF